MDGHGTGELEPSHPLAETGSPPEPPPFPAAFLAAALVAGELLLVTLISLRAVDAGEEWYYEVTNARPIVAALVLVPVVFLLAQVAARQVMIRERATVIAATIGGVVAQVFLYGFSRHPVSVTLSRDNFYSTATQYGAYGPLRRYEELAPYFELHAKANMPGKVVFYALVQQVTSSKAVAAYLVLCLSAVAGVLVYVVAKRLFGSRQAGLFGLLFAFFIPARTSFITSLNNVTAVIAMLLLLVTVLYLERPTARLVVAFGLLVYGAVLFDPATLLVAPFVLALLLRQVSLDGLPVGQIVRLALIALLAAAAAHVFMLVALGFDIFGALGHVSEDARNFNQRVRPRYSDWPIVNLREFTVNAGLALSLLVLAAFVDLVAAVVRGREPLRRVLLDPARLLTAVLVVTTVVLAVSGVNRGEVSRLWISLAIVGAMLGGAFCAERLPSWMFSVVLSCLALQTLFGQRMIRFLVVVLDDWKAPIRLMPYDLTYLVDLYVIGFLVVAAWLAVRRHRRPEPHAEPSTEPSTERSTEVDDTRVNAAG
jgi:hypothetical protein